MRTLNSGGADLTQLAAKNNQFVSVLEHGLAAGRMAARLWSDFLCEGTRTLLSDALGTDEAGQFLAYLASVHDIGKISPSFQAQLRGRPTRMRHEHTTHDVLLRQWGEPGDTFASILALHHQKHRGYLPDRTGGCWANLQAEFDAAMRDASRWNGPLPVIRDDARAAVSALLIGLVVLADWLASSGQKDLERIGLEQHPADFPADFRGLFPGKNPRPLQEAADRMFGPGAPRLQLVLIEGPMGDGKTAAALLCAVRLMAQWKKNGFCYALPTTAASDQMAERLRAFLRSHDPQASVRLLHAAAWATDRAAGTLPSDDGGYWLRPLRRGLLSQYACGTVDQALRAVLNVRHGEIRLLGLSGSVLVLDELHTYDMYTQTLIMRLCEWCRALQVPIVALSATLTAQARTALLTPYGGSPAASSPYPGITVVAENGRTSSVCVPAADSQRTVHVRLHQIITDPDAVAALARAETEAGGCAVVICNTVSRAQAVYTAIRDASACLLHARMPAWQRRRRERFVLDALGPHGRRPPRLIVVGTQILEQAADYDADIMLTDAAPADLLMQRAGRLHRHGYPGRAEPVLHVLTDAGSVYSHQPYPACLLRRTAALLADRDCLRFPADIAVLTAAGYVPDDADQGWAEWQALCSAQARATCGRMIGAPHWGYSPLGGNTQRPDDAAPTRDSSYQTVQAAIVPPDLWEALQRGQPTEDTARAVLGWSMNVPQWWLRHVPAVLHGNGLLSGVRILPQGNTGRIVLDEQIGAYLSDGGEDCGINT